MNNPVLLRILMVVAAVACFVATKFVADPSVTTALVGTGLFLLGWAKKAPGTVAAEPVSSQPGDTRGMAELRAIGAIGIASLLCIFGFAVACSALRQASPAERAQAVRDGMRLTKAACAAYQGTGGRSDPAVDEACFVFALAEKASVAVEQGGASP